MSTTETDFRMIKILEWTDKDFKYYYNYVQGFKEKHANDTWVEKELSRQTESKKREREKKPNKFWSLKVL